VHGFASEEAFLAAIDRHFPKAHPRLLVGRGDDGAVLLCPERMALTTDLFLEGVHFRTAYFTPAEAGHKALAVNLSDLAAMGARPLGFCLSLMVPPDIQKDTPGSAAEYWEGFFTGMAELAGRHDVALVGGDLSRAHRLGVSVTAWGEPGPSGVLLPRLGCRPGDRIFAAGAPHLAGLGLARAGLAALEEGGREAGSAWPEATRRHLRPEPMMDAGLALAGSGLVRTLMDISDGLARDLPRLLSFTLGAELSLDPASLHPEVRRFAERTGADPVEVAVLGGEDYGLLGTAAPEDMEALAEAVEGLAVIGEVTRQPGVRVNGRAWKLPGFDHFEG
jgi:thiamine-monophosphate kinase